MNKQQFADFGNFLSLPGQNTPEPYESILSFGMDAEMSEAAVFHHDVLEFNLQIVEFEVGFPLHNLLQKRYFQSTNNPQLQMNEDDVNLIRGLIPFSFLISSVCLV